MKNGKLLRVKVIKTEADLPKEEGEYFVGVKLPIDKDTFGDYDLWRWEPSKPNFDAEYWINSFNWYLQPIEERKPIEDRSAEITFNDGMDDEEQEISDEEIKDFIQSHPGNLGNFIMDKAVDAGFLEGAKMMRDHPEQFKTK